MFIVQACTQETRWTHYWNQQVVKMPADRTALKQIAYKEKHYHIIRMFWQRTEANNLSSACESFLFPSVWGELGLCWILSLVVWLRMWFRELPVSVRVTGGPSRSKGYFNLVLILFSSHYHRVPHYTVHTLSQIDFLWQLFFMSFWASHHLYQMIWSPLCFCSKDIRTCFGLIFTRQ